MVGVLVMAAAGTCLAGGAAGENINRDISLLVLELGVIIFAARLSGLLFERLRLPSVIGELCAGIVIGPYLLGGLSLPGLARGLFPLPETGLIPVRPELYYLAVIASILLLFNAGLETDLGMLLKYSVAGLVVGMCGVIVSFFSGVLVTVWILHLPLMHPASLFMGTICTATSVGIATRILHDAGKVESPEGIMILAGAVIDDIIGIVVLGVVVGIVTASGASGHGAVSWGAIGAAAGKSMLVWLAFTTTGLLAARRIAALLKRFKSITVFSVMALAMGLVLAAVFERVGLAMIVGAYVAGLALSRTDIRYVIVERLQPVYVLLVPVFFTIMGMFVNLRYLMSGRILLFGAAFTVAAITAKVAGCGLPSLFFGFNRIGALRIGLGMTPRSEVALIIAGVGLAQGFVDESTFGATVMMVFFSVLAVPPLLQRLMKDPRSGTRREVRDPQKATMSFHFPSPDITDFVAAKVLDYFTTEGFFVHSTLTGGKLYRLNRDDVHVSLIHHADTLVFETARGNVVFVKTLMYEALLTIHEAIGRLKHLAKPESMRREILQGDRRGVDVVAALADRRCITADLAGGTKRQIIEELVGLLDAAGMVGDRAVALGDVLDREESMSTGMQDGVALPHAKTAGVTIMCAAIGLKREGVDFQSLDGRPSRIFIMVLSPENSSGPHIQFLAGVSSLLNTAEARNALLECKTRDEIFAFFNPEK